MAEAVAIIGAGVSDMQARKQNANNERAMNQQIASENIAANQRRAVTGRNLAGVLGSVRASAAGRGVAGSASVIAEALSNIESGQSERSSIEINRTLGVAQAQSRYAAQYTNPLLAGFGSYLGSGGTFGTNGAFGKDTGK